jgi:hypothetical protein
MVSDGDSKRTFVEIESEHPSGQHPEQFPGTNVKTRHGSWQQLTTGFSPCSF